MSGGTPVSRCSSLSRCSTSARALPRRRSASLVGGPSGAVIAGTGALIGHWRPLFLGFRRGGKIVATTVGVVLVMAPLASVVMAVVWWMVLLATRYTSVASITASLVLPAACPGLRGHLGRGVLHARRRDRDHRAASRQHRAAGAREPRTDSRCGCQDCTGARRRRSPLSDPTPTGALRRRQAVCARSLAESVKPGQRPGDQSLIEIPADRPAHGGLDRRVDEAESRGGRRTVVWRALDQAFGPSRGNSGSACAAMRATTSMHADAAEREPRGRGIAADRRAR